LLILESCNNVIIEHTVKSLAELLNALRKKKAFYQNNAELLTNLAGWSVEEKSCSNNSLQKYKIPHKNSLQKQSTRFTARSNYSFFVRFRALY